VIEELIHGLAAGSDLTAEEILDVLWLSAIRATPQTVPSAAVSADPAVRGSPADEHALEPSRISPASPLAPDDRQDSELLPLRLPTGPSSASDDPAVASGAESVAAAEAGWASGERIPATEVGFGAPRLIRDSVGMPRALRRLRQVRRPSRGLAVDIDATVEATAAAGGTLVPVFTHPPERSLDLALVVDGAPEMRIWDDTFDEFARLMAQTGAFRSVERWRLVVDDEVSIADASGKVQSPRRLIDPSGRRVVFVATNASSEAWYTPGPWETIASWCAAMPTALIQVLPQHYWAGTAIGEPYVTTRAHRPAAPNAEYASRLAWWAHDPGGLPLPVVTLAPEAMETWAQAAVTGTAWAPGITAAPPDPEYSPSATAQADANVLVNDFLSRASPGAERLARILATASTLSMPLIAVLQESLAPETGVLELAEILSSGLLEADDPLGQPRFRFRHDTRQILYRGATTFEEWDTYAAVSHYLESRQRLGGPLIALLPDPEGTAALDSADEPFAALHEALATRLGLRAIPDGQSAPGPELDAASTPEGLVRLLVDEISQLRMPYDVLTVAVFGATGLRVWRISPDEDGTPIDTLTGSLLWAGLHEDDRLFSSQVDGAIDAVGRTLFINTAPSHPDAIAAMAIARGHYPSVSAHEYEADLHLAIHEAISRVPLTRSYELAVLSRDASSHLAIRSLLLFPPGAVKGDRGSVRIRCQPSDKNGIVFAVRTFYSSTPMLMTSARIAPRIYDLTAELLEPGVVRFEGLPSQPQEDLRTWSEIVATVPERLDMAGPVHLILAIEADAPEPRQSRRFDLARDLITTAEGSGAPVTVSVVLYGSQSPASAIPDDGPLVLTWTADARQAQDALRSGQRPTPSGAENSEIERALALIAARLSNYDLEGRPVLVTIGARSSSGNWRTPLNQLLVRHPGIVLGAINESAPERRPRGRAERIWAELGRAAQARLDNVNVRQFAVDLGLFASKSTPLPLPLGADPDITAGVEYQAQESAVGPATDVPPLLVRTVRATHRLESGPEYRIGRDNSADIPVSDPRVSWEHAVLYAVGDGWVLEDRGSRNGTFLGAEKVSRLDITGPCVIHVGNPEDGPVLRLEVEQVAEVSRALQPPADGWDQPDPNASLPGVDREPTSRISLQSARVVKIGRRPENDIVLADLGVSKLHAELRMSPTGRYQIFDMGSHNGTFVNGNKVNQAELTDDDIVSIGHATFRLAGGVIQEYIDEGDVTLEAIDLRVAVSDGGKQKVLLEGISFPLAERSMMAVIGPAGAGKSTLLNVLSGRRRADGGSVLYDHLDLYEHYDEFEHRIGFVPQHSSPSNVGSPRPLGRMRRVASALRQSVTFDQFSPRTALDYAAKLRFPRDISETERSQRVEEVLYYLALTPHANTRIDRLSTGQKKRVDIGLALLTKPSILFLEEPTSPLDPHLKRETFQQMRKLADPSAQAGQSVVLSSHDVDSKLLALCDRVLVLAPAGRMSYFGPPAEGLRYFGREDWADVFQWFSDEPGRDFADEYRASPEFVMYVATHMT
jgi:ABC-type multidrug transport system ATPase subunit/pSer/pThr/pTyr-binding forkhead associated (FHA) protein